MAPEGLGRDGPGKETFTGPAHHAPAPPSPLERLARMAFLVGLAAVMVLSLVPQDMVPSTDVSDKVNHLAAYGALAFAGAIGFRGRRTLVLLAAGLLALGGALEIAQGFVPGRMPSAGDLLADGIGIALGALVALAVNAWRGPRGIEGGPVEE